VTAWSLHDRDFFIEQFRATTALGGGPIIIVVLIFVWCEHIGLILDHWYSIDRAIAGTLPVDQKLKVDQDNNEADRHANYYWQQGSGEQDERSNDDNNLNPKIKLGARPCTRECFPVPINTNHKPRCVNNDQKTAAACASVMVATEIEEASIQEVKHGLNKKPRPQRLTAWLPSC
jgi:hypothetical protein